MAKKILCTGYGTGHRFADGTVFADGRLWFVCQKCRWNTNPVYETPKEPAYEPGFVNVKGKALNPAK
jgi:hypothetical protein